MIKKISIIFLLLFQFSTITYCQKKSQSKIKRTIFDFFKTDLKKIPDSTFIIAETYTTPNNETVQVYRKKINFKECGIFDIIEIRTFSANNRNIFFKAAYPDKNQLHYLKELVDQLYLIYGKSSNGKGLFSQKDAFQYTNDSIVFGRSWMTNKEKPYAISINILDNEISIGIFGVDQ